MRMEPITLRNQPGDAHEMDLIGEYLTWLATERRRRDTTIANRREILYRLDRDLPFGLARANADELRACLYRPGYSIGTINTYRTAVESFFTRCFDVRDPWLDGDNPMTWLPERPRTPKGVARPVTDEQLQRILAEACDPFRLWSLLAAYQGLRCIEIAGMDREHITETRLYVADGKGGQARWHATDPYVWAAVRDLPPGPIAVDWRTGQQATARFVSIKSAQYFRLKLGVPASMHMLRHRCGVNVQAAYRDIRVTQEVLGHRSLSSTQIYTRATVGQQRDALATLPRLAG